MIRLVLLALLLSMPALAAQPRPPRLQALLAGGSGEREGKNFFLDDFADFRKNLVERGWQVSIVAGPGARPAPFSSTANNLTIIGQLKGILNQASKGDEVLIVFHSHGQKRNEGWGQRSHSITTEQVDSTGAEVGLDLDRIEPLLEKAAGRGVRIGLVDLSCYSGATQALRGTACTVTLAAPNYVSLCSGRPEEKLFGSRFFKLPPQGQAASLESQFIEARRVDLESVNLPMISSRTTPAREGWEAFLGGLDPLDTLEDLREFRKGARPFDPTLLLSAIDENIKAKAGRKQKSDELLRKQIEEELKSAVAIRKKLEESIPTLAADYDVPGFELVLSSGEKFRLTAATLADLIEEASEKDATLDGWTDVQRHRLEAIRPVRASLEKRFKKPLDLFRQRRDEFNLLVTDLEAAAGALMTKERALYDALSDPVSLKSNGCEAFAL